MGATPLGVVQEVYIEDCTNGTEGVVSYPILRLVGCDL